MNAPTIRHRLVALVRHRRLDRDLDYVPALRATRVDPLHALRQE